MGGSGILARAEGIHPAGQFFDVSGPCSTCPTRSGATLLSYGAMYAIDRPGAVGYENGWFASQHSRIPTPSDDGRVNMQDLPRRMGAIPCCAACSRASLSRWPTWTPGTEGELMLQMLDTIDWMLTSPYSMRTRHNLPSSPPNATETSDLSF